METHQIESFSEAIDRAEKMEREKGGLTDEVMALRMLAKEKYPAEFAEYLKNKTNKSVGAGDVIHENFYGQQRMGYLKKGDYNKLKP
ncbi:MAG: hypothetical protein ABIH38_04880 [Patescibacteria group bacterium]